MLLVSMRVCWQTYMKPNWLLQNSLKACLRILVKELTVLRSYPALDAASNNFPKNFLFIGTSSSPRCRSMARMCQFCARRIWTSERDMRHGLPVRHVIIMSINKKHTPSISISRGHRRRVPLKQQWRLWVEYG